MAEEVPWNAGLRVEGVEVQDGDLRLLPGPRELGHLGGWGRGRWSEPGDPSFQRSAAGTPRARLRLRLAGEGRGEIVLAAPRIGELRVPVYVSAEAVVVGDAEPA